METPNEVPVDKEGELVRLAKDVRDGTTKIQVLFDKFMDDPECAAIAARLEHIDIQEMESASGVCCGNLIASNSIEACYLLLKNAKEQEGDSQEVRELRRRAADLLTRKRPHEWTVMRSINEKIERHMKRCHINNGETPKSFFDSVRKNDAALTVDAQPPSCNSRRVLRT
jgi:hypothetical protein